MNDEQLKRKMLDDLGNFGGDFSSFIIKQCKDYTLSVLPKEYIKKGLDKKPNSQAGSFIDGRNQAIRQIKNKLNEMST